MKRVFVTIGLFVLFLAPTLWAGVPLVLNHQGRLLDGNDQPVSGTVQLTFSVYTLETGSAVLLYTETQSGITVTDGLFNVLIGDVVALPDSISSHNPLELGISVNGEAELTPRMRLGSVPFALGASRVTGDIETGPGSLRVPNIGSSGQDGVSITGTQEKNRLSVPNIGSSGQDGVSMTAFNVTKRNAITATQQNEASKLSIQISTDSSDGTTLEMSSRLNGLPPGEPVIGTLKLATDDSSSHIQLGKLTGALKTYVEQAIASSQARLTVSNIGSSGQDGVNMVTNDSGTTLQMSSRLNGLPPGTPVIGTLSLTTNDTSARVAIGDLDGDGLVDIVAGGGGATLRVRSPNGGLIGSSGQDGVSITAFNVTKRNAITATQQNEASSRSVLISTDSADGTTLEMSSRLNGLPPGTPVTGTLRLTTNDSTASIAIGDPDFDLLRLQGGGSGGSLSITGDPDFDLLRMEAGADSATIRISGRSAGDPDFDLLRIGRRYSAEQYIEMWEKEQGRKVVSIKADSTGGSMSITGDPDFDLLRMSADADSAKIRISGQVASDPDFDVVSINGDSTGGRFVLVSGSTGSSSRVKLEATGTVGKIGINTDAPSEALHVVGNICATGTIGACSDGRYKNKVETIGDALSVIEKLRGVDFEWNRSAFPANQFAEGKQVGFVAQEMKEILPELVSQGSDGYLSVDYGRMTPVLVEAIKAQQKVIENQNGELSAVKTRLEELQKLVSKLLEESNSSTIR